MRIMGILSSLKISEFSEAVRGYRTYSIKSHGPQPSSLGFYVAFEGRPKKKSSWKRVYKGIKCGCGSAVGPRDVVVKCPDTGEDAEETCEQEVRRARKVRQLAARFQKKLSPSVGVRLSVEVPLKAWVSEDSFPGPHCVLVEERVAGDFVQLTDAAGRSLHPSFDVLEMFASDVYHETCGTEVIGQLQGCYHGDNAFHLVSPSLHSVSGSYGPRDEGQSGVRHFQWNHQCTKACWELQGRAEPTAPPIYANEETSFEIASLATIVTEVT